MSLWMLSVWLLIAVIGRHAYSFPVQNGWGQSEPEFDGILYNMDYSSHRNDGFLESSYNNPGYDAQNGYYVQPTDPFPYQSMREEVPLGPVINYDGLSDSEGYQAGYSYTPAASPAGSGGAGDTWWGPPSQAGTTTTHLPPTLFQRGEPPGAIHEDVDSESKTQQHDNPFDQRYQPEVFQPGETGEFESSSDHGYFQGETQEEGFRPRQQTAQEAEQTREPPGEDSADVALSTADGEDMSLSSILNLIRLFKRGQLPGTMHHHRAERKQGEDQQEEMQYKRRGFYRSEPLPPAVQTVYRGY